jgi:hypothetical protein
VCFAGMREGRDVVGIGSITCCGNRVVCAEVLFYCVCCAVAS